MRNPARDEADRWTTALGVPAGTSPEDALRLVVERERAAVVAHLLARQDAAIRRRPMMLTPRLEDVTVGQILEAGEAAAEIQRGEHVREGGDNA